MELPQHAVKNRSFWDRTSDDYQERHGAQLDWRKDPGWGVWDIPERSLRILGDVKGKDVLEFGCGAAQWSIRLRQRGAQVVGLDLSEQQLTHARRLMREAGVEFPLLLATAEKLPFADESFDIVFCDHGAMTFADPLVTVPEAWRVLRAQGLLAFNMSSPFLDICWSEHNNTVDRCLQRDYFGLRLLEDADNVTFQLTYGEWLRLFRSTGFVVEDLVELQAPENAVTTYGDYVPLAWARRWPAENIWKVRKMPLQPSPRD